MQVHSNQNRPPILWLLGQNRKTRKPNLKTQWDFQVLNPSLSNAVSFKFAVFIVEISRYSVEFFPGQQELRTRESERGISESQGFCNIRFIIIFINDLWERFYLKSAFISLKPMRPIRALLPQKRFHKCETHETYKSAFTLKALS